MDQELKAPVEASRPRHRRPDMAPAQRSAIAAAYRAHGDAVYALSRRLCGATLAADVTQDVFLQLWMHPDRFDPARGSMRSFLLTVARGTAVSTVRSDARRRAREDRVARSTPEEGNDLDRIILQRECSAEISAAVDRLPRRERDAIVVTFYGHCTYREAAIVLSQREGTVKSRIRAGLRRLGDDPVVTSAAT